MRIFDRSRWQALSDCAVASLVVEVGGGVDVLLVVVVLVVLVVVVVVVVVVVGRSWHCGLSPSQTPAGVPFAAAAAHT